MGAGGVAAVTSASGSSTLPATAPPAASPSAVALPPPSPAPSDAVRPAETLPSTEPVSFGVPATDSTGMSLTVLRPERINHGVRLTIALANTTDAPIVVDTGELGPHDQTFDGAAVPMTMTSTKKKVMPGEGYTYQAVITLPTTNIGQLELRLGTVTVAGQAECGTRLS